VTDGPRPLIVVVSDRRRLCQAVGRPLGDAADLLAAQARAAAACGAAVFQLREPDLGGGALLALAVQLAAAAGPRLRVVVNDRADVAAAAGLGVHLRERSLPTARVRAWLPAGTWLSRAVHDATSLSAAGAVDLVIAGTVAATASKPDGKRLGLDGLRQLAAASLPPLVGIGGLSAADWPALRAAGAAGFAAIGTFLPVAGESIAGAMARATRIDAAVVDSPGGVS
jgi:thiamine-phosphate pyrophosphorylase